MEILVITILGVVIMVVDLLLQKEQDKQDKMEETHQKIKVGMDPQDKEEV